MVGTWTRLAHAEVEGSAGTLVVSSIPARENLMIVCNMKHAANGTAGYFGLVFNDDGSSEANGKYASRRAHNGGADQLRTSSDSLYAAAINGAYSETNWAYSVTHMNNNSGRVKLCKSYLVGANTDGAYLPRRVETAATWHGTDQVNKIQLTDAEGDKSVTWAVGSYITVYGASDDAVTDEKTTLTNVPVNTRYEETDTRKIYRKVTPDTADYETDFSSSTGWSSSSTSQLEVTNNELQIKQVTFSHNQINYDLSSQVSGGSLSDSWVLRYDLEWSGSSGSPSPLFWINIADNTNKGNENQDSLNLQLYHGQSSGFKIQKSDGIRPDQSGSGSVDLSPTTAIGYGTKYYIEHIRDGQDFTVNVRTGSHTGTLVCSGTISSFPSTITGLKYFKVITYQGTSTSGVLDNLKFYNGISSVDTDEWKERGNA